MRNRQALQPGESTPVATLVWTRIIPNCARRSGALGAVRRAGCQPRQRSLGLVGTRSRGEQSMVLESCGLVGDRTGPVHGLQAVRPWRQPGLADRLLRLP